MNKLSKHASQPSPDISFDIFRVVYNKPTEGRLAWCDCKVYEGQKVCPELFAEAINLELLEPGGKDHITQSDILSWSKIEYSIYE